MRVFYSLTDGVDKSADVRRLLRCAWESLFGSTMPMIAKDQYGKPYFETRPDVFFSLSHSKGAVLCAIGEVPVGADIERRREVSDALVRHVTSPEERGLDFFSLWCLKESYIKLLGRQTMPLRQMRFRLCDGRITAPDPTVTALAFNSIPGFAAAVCFRGEADVSFEYVAPDRLSLLQE